MYHSLRDFRQEVIDTICEIEGCDEENAHLIAEEKHGDIEYGHKNRLSPRVIAGAILGINDCCISPGSTVP